MKIGLVFDDSLDRNDGVQQYVLTLGRWFTQQGHKVHYLVGQTKRKDLANAHSLSRNMGVRFNGNRLTIPLPANSANIKELLNRERYDVLHIQMPYSPFMGAKVIKNAPAGTRLVGTFHILPLGWLQKVGTQLLSWRLKRNIAKLHQVWSVSKPAAKFAADMGIKSTVLPNVVELDKFNTAKPFKKYANDFTVVFLGRLVPRKGCATLIEATHAWQAYHPDDNFKLVICGTGPEQAHLERWVIQHRMQDVVEFTGYISEEDKPRYLASANIAVFPSLGGESFGIVLLEAMAARSGVVLGGQNPGYASVLGEVNGALFDAKKPEELAKLLHKHYEDTAAAKKLHDAQQKLVLQYDVAVVGKKLLSYYQAS